MRNQDFTEISKRYRETSIIQNSAAEILFALLDIKENEAILDVGCGTGNLTIKLVDKSKGYIPAHLSLCSRFQEQKAGTER